MSTTDPKGYYRRLGVDPAASIDQIKAAYRRLAKELHPDKNAGADAKARFQAINEAYQTVGDPERRAAYDSLRYATPPEPTREAPLEPISCSRCGKVTAQPRAAVFWYVVSVIVLTSRNPIQGIFCATCARKAALKASLISAIAGWWGFPWGPIYTIGSIFKNAIGGFRPPGSEERLLWYNALAFLSQGNLPLAYALARKVRKASDEKIAINAVRLMDHLQAAGVPADTRPLKNPWRLTIVDLFAHAATLFALPLILVGLSYQEEIGAWWAGKPIVAQQPYVPPRSLLASPPLATSSINGAAPSATNATPTCATPSINGAVLGGYAASMPPGHKIEIKNGSDGDAIVKIRDANSGRLAASFFVARNATAAFGTLPDGTYRIQYAFGNALKQDCRSFVRFVAGQFPDLETLRTTYTGNQIVHDHITYTLYGVPAGNVRPQSLDAATFDAE